MTTANRRASATIALFMPRRLAICIAQALSQDQKRSTKIFQLSTSRPADYPIFWHKADIMRFVGPDVRF